MAAVIKPGWSKPSNILFASDCPPDEKAFAFALAEAAEFSADLIILHAYDSSDKGAPDASAICGDNDATARKPHLEALAQRAMDAGIRCEIVVRPGLAADQTLTFLRERKIDRVVMGAHCPDPVGKLLVGSVTAAVLRNANVPVCIVGPNLVATLSPERSSAMSASQSPAKWWHTSVRNWPPSTTPA
jgi:nucleotide-binding universal stress UspA family protein